MPSQKPAKAGRNAHLPLSADCSIAGTIRLQIDAATITPAAKPVRARCTPALRSSFRKNTQAAPAAAYGSYAADTAAEAEDAWIESPGEMKSESGFSSRDNGQVPSPENMAEKIIYNAEVTLETTEFDTALDRINALVTELGGFMESTSISGSTAPRLTTAPSGARLP